MVKFYCTKLLCCMCMAIVSIIDALLRSTKWYPAAQWIIICHKYLKKIIGDQDVKTIMNKDFIIDLQNGALYVLPYWFEQRTNVKKRWEGKSLRKIFFSEWNYLEKELGEIEMENYCKNGQILINDKECQLSQTLQHNDVIKINVHKHEPPINGINCLKIIYETNDIIVIHKPSTIPIHPSSLYYKNSIIWMLENGYVHKYHHNQSINCMKRQYDNVWFNNLLHQKQQIINYCSFPLQTDNGKQSNNQNKNKNKFFIIHRLDRLTSGLLIIGRNQKITKYLMDQFKNRMIHKTYFALCFGKFDESKFKIVNAKIGKSSKYHNQMVIDDENGKEAVTKFKLIWYNKTRNISLILCEPLQGRTHQIRIHLSCICKTPILNDPLYNTLHGDKHEFNDNKEMLYISNLSKSKQCNDNGFKCHICNDKIATIDKWWNNLCLTTSASNIGIYLHAFKYKGKDFEFQTEIPHWVCPPDNNTVYKLTTNNMYW